MINNSEKVEDIFHGALALPDAERLSFLQRECRNDSELIAEIQSLLSGFENDSDFLDEPVFDLGLNAIGQQNQRNLAGQTIGNYELLEKIGEGGMGTVYKAFDKQLTRTVALKFLSETLEKDKAARRRLVREAQAAAALEHPNICAVYGIEETAEHHFIVMQFIEGQTLAEKIKGEPVGINEFKTLSKQILSAVALAHSHGIIHRDIKPGNIMLTTDGQIKVLDFGLAKIVKPPKILGNGSQADTSIFSQHGQIIGTVSNMSPEQLRGEKLDFTSDIFSIGIVLYELLTKQNPFNRPSQAETIAAILNEDCHTLNKLELNLPSGLCKLVEKCLQKNTAERFQSTAEILVEIDHEETLKTTQPIYRQQSFWLKTAIVTMLLCAVMVIVFFNFKTPQRTLAILPFSIENSIIDKEYLADGLTQSIIEKLSNLSDLKVDSPTIVARFKGKNDKPENAGKELGVDAIMVGSITNRPEGLYLETKLIRTSDGNPVDIFEYKIEESKLIELPENIANRIISQVRLKLTDEDKLKLSKKDTYSEEAKNKYMQGRYYLKRRIESSDIETATNYFFEAKELDQNYAQAWAGLADAYLAQSTLGIKGTISPKNSVKLAKIAAQKALELNNSLSESYTSLGLISLRYEWNWNEAEGYFRTAISRNPEFLSPRFGLVSLLGILERYDEATEEINKIKKIDPLSLSADIEMAIIYYKKKDFQQMDIIMTDLLVKFPENRRVKYIRSYQLLKTQRFAEAIQILEKFYESNNVEDKLLASAPLGFALAKTGKRKNALNIIDKLNTFAELNYVPSQEKAMIYLGLGELDRVFENLNKSCSEKYPSLTGWLTDPLVEEARTDPRFSEIKKCLNF